MCSYFFKKVGVAQECIDILDLVTRFRRSVCFDKSASIQPRMSLQTYTCSPTYEPPFPIGSMKQLYGF